jgi:hypothetical protein
MFHISSDITIHSNLSLNAVAILVADALCIPPFVNDSSGRWEEQEVFVSKCLGLEFVFGHSHNSPLNEYGLSIDSLPNKIPNNGNEKEVDATKYILALLCHVQDISAIAG